MIWGARSMSRSRLSNQPCSHRYRKTPRRFLRAAWASCCRFPASSGWYLERNLGIGGKNGEKGGSGRRSKPLRPARLWRGTPNRGVFGEGEPSLEYLGRGKATTGGRGEGGVPNFGWGGPPVWRIWGRGFLVWGIWGGGDPKFMGEPRVW